MRARNPTVWYNKRMKREKSSFKDAVTRIVRSIPKGKTLTYKKVAGYAGHPGASRAVGTLMSKNFDPKIPCHRIVRTDGKIGNYNRGGSRKKEKILRMENAFDKDGNLKMWDPSIKDLKK